MAIRNWFDNLWPMGGVLSASLLIAWATEVLSFFLSRGLAFAALALLQVLPEFAVEAVITSEAALNPANLQYVTANFTGANRLIVGLFIPMVFIMAAFRGRRAGRRITHLELPVTSSVEIVALIVPTVYSFIFVIRGSLGLADAVLLVGMYAVYLFLVFKLPPSEEGHEDLPLVPRTIRGMTPARQKWLILLFFLLGGFLLLQSVHPFYKNTLALGAALGISSYFLLQWMAPFLSEFPEFITILYWGRTGRAQLGLTNAISSKINQWTLLIAMIPVVYVLVSWNQGAPLWEIRFNDSQRLEVLLTAAQGLFAAACFLNLRLTRWEAYTLLGLWAFQLLDPLLDKPIFHAFPNLPYVFEPMPDPVTGELVPHFIREWTTVAYLGLTIIPLFFARGRFAAFHGFRSVMRTHLAKRPRPAPAPNRAELDK